MAKAAQLDVILRALILDAEALLARHIAVLDRSLRSSQDYEVFELRETIVDAKESLRTHRPSRRARERAD